MKKLLTIMFAAMALPAAAQTDKLDVMLDLRVDGQYTNTEGYETLGFRGQTFKVWFAGEIAPGVRYRVRHRLNKPTDPAREGFSAATDQAWLAFDFGRRKDWTVTVGKQSVQFGTFEYDYNPADVYLPTLCFDDLDAYKTGVNVAWRVAGQTINVQVVNSDSPQFASAVYGDKAMAALALWEGSLWQDRVKTRWAYGAFQHTKKKVYSWVTAGVQFNEGRFTGEVDYYFGDRKMNYGGVVGGDTGLRFVRDQSASLNLKYDFGKWRPQLKGTWNARYDKDLRDDAYGGWGVQAVAEFFPFSDPRLENLRFHAAYMYSDTEFGGGAYDGLPSVGAHTALVGVRWLFKVK